MRGILIKAAEKKVVAVDVKPAPNKSLDGLRALIGCEWVQPVIVSESLTLWLDEEERLKQSTAGFLLNGVPWVFVSNGVLLGGDASRARVFKASPEVVALGVRWLAPDQVPPPGPPQLVFFP